MTFKKGDKITHPIYGNGEISEIPITVDSHQWSGTAAWCCFYNPQTAIAAGWPYLVPVSDLKETEARSTHE